MLPLKQRSHFNNFASLSFTDKYLSPHGIHFYQLFACTYIYIWHTKCNNINTNTTFAFLIFSHMIIVRWLFNFFLQKHTCNHPTLTLTHLRNCLPLFQLLIPCILNLYLYYFMSICYFSCFWYCLLDFRLCICLWRWRESTEIYWCFIFCIIWYADGSVCQLLLSVHIRCNGGYYCLRGCSREMRIHSLFCLQFRYHW